MRKKTRLACLALTAITVTAGVALAYVVHSHRVPVVDYSELIDLGPRERGEIVVTHVTLANHGRYDLLIDHITSDCSCAGLEQERDGELMRLGELRLAPGDSAQLTLRVAVRGQPGSPFETAVHFQTNDPKHRLGTIRVSVPRILGMSIRPTSVPLGDVLLGTHVHREIEISDIGGNGIQVLAARSTRPNVVCAKLAQVFFEQPVRSGNASVPIARVEITVDALQEGSLDSTIELTITMSGRQETVSVPVSGRSVPPVIALPNQLNLPRNSGGVPVYSASCLCKHVKGDDFCLQIDYVSAGLRATIEESSDSSTARILKVEWDHKRARNPGGRIVRLRANGIFGDRFITIHVDCAATEG
jgi:hypothetical protein